MRTYGDLRTMNGKWMVSNLEPHVAIKFKAIFAKVPKHSAGPFLMPGDEQTACDLAWFTGRYPLAIGDDDLGRLIAGRDRYEATAAEVGRIMAVDYQPPSYAGLQPGQVVRQYQGQAAELLARFGGLLVADDMGAGKTYTGGACCLLPGALPATVVCPPHLKAQWVRKLREFTTLEPYAVRGTQPYRLPGADVRIFGFTQIAGWIDALEGLGTGLCVFDEGHELRRGIGTSADPIAKGLAADRLAAASRFRLMLTGTPIFNYGDEIWNLMSFVRPEALGEYADFQREFCSGRVVKDPEALGTYLREQHAMVRMRGEKPEANRVIDVIDHDADELASVEHLARRLATKATTGSFHERGEAVRELDMMMRMQTGIAKAPYVARYVRILVEAGEPVIMFGWHREVYEIWLRELSDLGVVMYTGSESPTQKAKSQQRFLAGEAQVFIMSLRSGAGVDGLQQRASTCVFGELDWSPAMHEQCIARLNREGQRCWPESVNAIFLVAEDGSDPPMQEVLGLKASQAHHIVDPGLGPQRQTSDIKPIERLIARYLDKGVAA